uniref:F-box/LRR-repeat protein 15/At3g58940/PEG3-like LRR domain-containing protein n=1 Tax=Dunaliella tertiolecta TaxID=3047 RepID=A0A7S3VVM0_DUNTE
MSTSTTLTLLDLNKDCLGAIYSQLGTKEDRMSFFHSCKALHDTLKSKVYKLVLHVGEQGSAGEELSEQGSAEEQPLSVDDALRTFPGAVLRSIKLVGPIPREWLTLKGPLQHAAHVTELDVAQPVDYELLDVATLCRLFPNLTSLHVFDKWATTGEGSFRPLQDLKHLRQLTLSHPLSIDPPEDLELILATCHRLESLTLATFPVCSKDLTLHCRSIKHICIVYMHVTALCDFCWHLEHDAFPNLESIAFGEAIILLGLEHLKASTAKIKLGTRLFRMNLLRLPDTFNVLGFSRADFLSHSQRRAGLVDLGFVDFAPVFSALIEGGMEQGTRNVSSLHLDNVWLSCSLVLLLGRAFANVRQLTLGVNVCMSESELIQCVTAFPLLCCLKVQGEPVPSSTRHEMLMSMIYAAQKRESPGGLHIVLPDSVVSGEVVGQVMEEMALCEGPRRIQVTINLSCI